MCDLGLKFGPCPLWALSGLFEQARRISAIGGKPDILRCFVEIDNRGQRLTGCITCNLWTAGEAKGWTRLSVEEPRVLHQLRNGGYK